MHHNKLVLYIHGKGGSAAESRHYESLFPGWNVVGLSYTASTPWEANAEFPQAFDALVKPGDRVILIANSIGAYLSMVALREKPIEAAFFVSPIVDMEVLIHNMMGWAGITEDELKARQQIETTFGETLRWDYLTYVRNHPIQWDIPTSILYGELDNLTDRTTIEGFSAAIGAELTVMPGGEHWFHTSRQMAFLNDWIQSFPKA